MSQASKSCPETGRSCIYLSCVKAKGCVIQTPSKAVPFKRASKLEPTPPKSKPKKGKK